MSLTHALARGAAAPVRLGLSATELGLEAVLGTVRGIRRAFGGGPDGRPRPAPPGDRAGSVTVLPGRSAERPPPAAAPAPAAPSRTAGRRAKAAPPPAEAVDPPPPVSPAAAAGPAVPATPPPGAKQVDDEAVTVGEFGERGAVEPAGAEVHVDPPWDGYDGMTAAQIRARLARADREVAAAVALYEASRRGRRSVAEAADRRLRAAADR